MQVLSKFLTLSTEYVPTPFNSKLLLALGAYYLIHKAGISMLCCHTDALILPIIVDY
jgi:hypothetical protein